MEDVRMVFNGFVVLICQIDNDGEEELDVYYVYVMLDRVGSVCCFILVGRWLIGMSVRAGGRIVFVMVDNECTFCDDSEIRSVRFSAWGVVRIVLICFCYSVECRVINWMFGTRWLVYVNEDG